jgi:hypothetical protein
MDGASERAIARPRERDDNHPYTNRHKHFHFDPASTPLMKAAKRGIHTPETPSNTALTLTYGLLDLAEKVVRGTPPIYSKFQVNGVFSSKSSIYRFPWHANRPV